MAIPAVFVFAELGELAVFVVLGLMSVVVASLPLADPPGPFAPSPAVALCWFSLALLTLEAEALRVPLEGVREEQAQTADSTASSSIDRARIFPG